MTLCEVVPNLFIGSLVQANDLQILHEYDIRCIISLGCEVSESIPITRVAFLDILDTPDYIISSYLNVCCDLIDRNLSHGVSTLVHCVFGQSRSATVVAAYLIHRHSFDSPHSPPDLMKIINYLHERNSDISINPGFLYQLSLMIRRVNPLSVDKVSPLLEYDRDRSRVAVAGHLCQIKAINEQGPPTDLRRFLDESLHSFTVVSEMIPLDAVTTPLNTHRITCKNCKSVLAFDSVDIIRQEDSDCSDISELIAGGFWKDFRCYNSPHSVAASSLPMHGHIVISCTAKVLRNLHCARDVNEGVISCDECGHDCGFWRRGSLTWCRGFISSFLFALRCSDTLRRRI
jgi:Dual specificity phosphatase, catalytic domain